MVLYFGLRSGLVNPMSSLLAFHALTIRLGSPNRSPPLLILSSVASSSRIVASSPRSATAAAAGPVCGVKPQKSPEAKNETLFGPAEAVSDLRVDDFGTLRRPSPAIPPGSPLHIRGECRPADPARAGHARRARSPAA